MKKFLNYGNTYIQQSNWKDLALIKFCLCAIGILWGMALPQKVHKSAAYIAISVFIVTYIPLMLKFFKVVKVEETHKELIEE